MNETDVLVNAGLSRTNAEMVVALHTMASALAPLAAANQASQQPTAEQQEMPPVVSGEVVDANE